MKVIVFVVMSIIIIILVVFIVIFFESYSKKQWLFSPYVPDPPEYSCYPLINIVQLDPDQKKQRDLLLQQLSNELNPKKTT